MALMQTAPWVRTAELAELFPRMAESFVWGWYIALVFGSLYNFRQEALVTAGARITRTSVPDASWIGRRDGHRLGSP